MKKLKLRRPYATDEQLDAKLVEIGRGRHMDAVWARRALELTRSSEGECVRYAIYWAVGAVIDDQIDAMIAQAEAYASANADDCKQLRKVVREAIRIKK